MSNNVHREGTRFFAPRHGSHLSQLEWVFRKPQEQLMKRQTKNSTSTATVVTVLPSQGCSLGCTVCNGGECIWGTSHGRTVCVALPSRRVVAPEGSVAAHPPSGPRSRSASSRSRFRRHAETCTPRHAHRERDAATGGPYGFGGPRDGQRLRGLPQSHFTSFLSLEHLKR